MPGKKKAFGRMQTRILETSASEGGTIWPTNWNECIRRLEEHGLVRTQACGKKLRVWTTIKGRNALLRGFRTAEDDSGW